MHWTYPCSVASLWLVMASSDASECPVVATLQCSHSANWNISGLTRLLTFPRYSSCDGFGNRDAAVWQGSNCAACSWKAIGGSKYLNSGGDGPAQLQRRSHVSAARLESETPVRLECFGIRVASGLRQGCIRVASGQPQGCIRVASGQHV
jgi:hypothetical protein